MTVMTPSSSVLQCSSAKSQCTLATEVAMFDHGAKLGPVLFHFNSVVHPDVVSFTPQGNS